MPRRLLFLVAGLVAVTSCSRSSSAAFITQSTGQSTIPVATTLAPVPTSRPVLAVPPAEAVVITGAGFDLHTSGKVSAAAFDAAWAGVLDTLNRYLEVAVVNPLRTGGPAGDLAPYFSGPAAAKVTVVGPDRGAFIEESLPPVTDLRKEAAVAKLTALAGADGTMSVIAADLDIRLAGHIAGGPVTVARTGELVLMPEGGRWRIDAYDLKVVRTRADTTTTTAVRS